MKKHETQQARQERLERNKDKRGFNRRIHNNRKGQPLRWQRQQMGASAHYARMVKFKYL